jgi:glucose-1-phosphate thymidylyltransferase
MKAIILAAGYATRLFPLTKDKPKALLPIDNRPIIEYIIDKLEKIDEVDEIFVASNGKFYPAFEEWLNNFKSSKPVSALNDHTFTNETRLGGLGNLWQVIQEKQINDDLLVIAGDNLFDFSLKDMFEYFKKDRQITVATHELKTLEEAKRFGVVSLDENKIITGFEEKPENPKFKTITHAIYIYPKEFIKNIEEYMKTDLNKDGPGYLIEHFYKTNKMKGFLLEGGLFFDIGIPEDYKKADQVWKELNSKK